MTDPETSTEAVGRAIGMCRAHGLHGTETTLRALSAAHAAALVRERDANAKAMQHLRRAEAAEELRDVLSSTLAEMTRRRNRWKAIAEGQDFTRLYLEACAERDALRAELAEAVEVLTLIENIRPMWEGGVRGPGDDNLSNALEHMRAEARAFLARHQKGAGV